MSMVRMGMEGGDGFGAAAYLSVVGGGGRGEFFFSFIYFLFDKLHLFLNLAR